MPAQKDWCPPSKKVTSRTLSLTHTLSKVFVSSLLKSHLPHPPFLSTRTARRRTGLGNAKTKNKKNCESRPLAQSTTHRNESQLFQENLAIGLSCNTDCNRPLALSPSLSRSSTFDRSPLSTRAAPAAAASTGELRVCVCVWWWWCSRSASAEWSV